MLVRSSISAQLKCLQWRVMLIGMFATAAIAQALSGWQNHVQQEHAHALSSTLTDEPWLSMQQHVVRLSVLEKPFIATTEVFGASWAATSPHFRALTRLYGMPGSNEPLPPDNEPLPPDEVTKFHQLETGLPVALVRLTSKFGKRANPFGKGHTFHRGIDIAAPLGTPVLAVAEGTIVTSRHHPTYGKYVVIDHHNGYHTLYAHNSELLVKSGERVKAGQNIAKVGSTGRSTGPHLHFEIHRDGTQVDPYPYLATM